MHETEKRKLNDLQAVITAEIARRSRTGFTTGEMAEWLIEKHRETTLSALEALVIAAAAKWNDERRVKGILKRNPDMKQIIRGVRMVSETLGVSAWYLLTLPHEDLAKAYGAMVLAGDLQSAEAQATLNNELAELAQLEPVWKDHPEMTTGEAMVELKKQTDETLRGLDERQ
jgi:hypothetical protein